MLVLSVFYALCTLTIHQDEAFLFLFLTNDRRRKIPAIFRRIRRSVFLFCRACNVSGIILDSLGFRELSESSSFAATMVLEVQVLCVTLPRVVAQF